MTPDPVPDKLTDEERQARADAMQAVASRGDIEDLNVLELWDASWLAARDFYAARGSVTLPNNLDAALTVEERRADGLIDRAEQAEARVAELEDAEVLNSAAGLLAEALRDGNLRNHVRAAIDDWLTRFDPARAALVAAPSRPEGDEETDDRRDR